MNGTEKQSWNWARILTLLGGSGALLAALTALAAGFGSRAGLWHFRSGFALLAAAAYLGMAAAALSLFAAVVAARTKQWRMGVLALAGLLVGSLIVAIPLAWRHKAGSVPPIHDISTDLDHPPAFVAILPLRQGAANPAAYGGPEVARQQRAAYPEIAGVVLPLPPTEAFAKALAAATELNWTLVAAVPDEGRIEASDTTFWFGFVDDIVIRITADPTGSRVDIRSLSRVGRSDVGTNAERIRSFVRRLNAE